MMEYSIENLLAKDITLQRVYFIIWCNAFPLHQLVSTDLDISTIKVIDTAIHIGLDMVSWRNDVLLQSDRLDRAVNILSKLL